MHKRDPDLTCILLRWSAMTTILVHKLRQDKAYLPELSRIAVKDGEVIGCIMYSMARVVDGADVHEVLTFGPLCVDPKWQGRGVVRNSPA